MLKQINKIKGLEHIKSYYYYYEDMGNFIKILYKSKTGFKVLNRYSKTNNNNFYVYSKDNIRRALKVKDII